MEWLNSLFFEHTPLQAVVILSIIIAVGLGLGKIHLFGISLGVTFVFFAGILAGHLGFSIDSNMLNYAESFGLVLFVYELGLQVGPGFFSSFRKGGVQLNMLGMGVILTGTVMTVLFSKLGDIPMSDMVGILCGATTNTPALGAAQQTLKQMGEPASGAALSCAVTYPLGVVGVILAMLLVRKLFVRPSDIDIHEHEDTNQTFIATFKVHNPAIFNKSIKEIALLSYPKFVISRLWREGTVSIPTSEKILKENDRLLVITTEKDAPSLTILFGEQESQAESNAALAANLPLTFFLMFVTLLFLFKTYRKPIVILLMLPLIFIGIVLGLLLLGKTFDFFAILGLLGLIGMNIKNAIVLVDQIDAETAAGKAPREAVISATTTRIVPVAMASGTTILGMLPLLFDAMFGGMAATIMGGLLVASALTLFVLPVAYCAIHKIKG